MARPLLPDDLRAAIAPLLPPHPLLPRGGRPRVDDRAALTGILFVLRSDIPREMLPAEMTCRCGMSCWRRLRDRQAAGMWRARSTGAGRASTVRACRRRKGVCHRPEPDGSGQGGDQAPPRHRRARHAARPRSDRCPLPRQPADGPDAGRDPASAQRAARTPARAPRQAARRQGLRCQGAVAGVPGARDQAADCPARHRAKRRARAASLGGRAQPCLVQPRPPLARQRRTARRHLRRLHVPPAQPRHTHPDRAVLSGALNTVALRRTHVQAVPASTASR